MPLLPPPCQPARLAGRQPSLPADEMVYVALFATEGSVPPSARHNEHQRLTAIFYNCCCPALPSCLCTTLIISTIFHSDFTAARQVSSSYRGFLKYNQSGKVICPFPGREKSYCMHGKLARFMLLTTAVFKKKNADRNLF